VLFVAYNPRKKLCAKIKFGAQTMLSRCNCRYCFIVKLAILPIQLDIIHIVQARSISRPPRFILVLVKECTLPACPHRIVSRLQRRCWPVFNAAQGYRLGLPSAVVRASPDDAVKNEKCQFLALTHHPRQFFAPKIIPGVPYTLKICRQSILLFPSYK